MDESSDVVDGCTVVYRKGGWREHCTLEHWLVICDGEVVDWSTQASLAQQTCKLLQRGYRAGYEAGRKRFSVSVDQFHSSRGRP